MWFDKRKFKILLCIITWILIRCFASRVESRVCVCVCECEKHRNRSLHSVIYSSVVLTTIVSINGKKPSRSSERESDKAFPISIKFKSHCAHSLDLLTTKKNGKRPSYRKHLEHAWWFNKMLVDCLAEWASKRSWRRLMNLQSLNLESWNLQSIASLLNDGIKLDEGFWEDLRVVCSVVTIVRDSIVNLRKRIHGDCRRDKSVLRLLEGIEVILTTLH